MKRRDSLHTVPALLAVAAVIAAAGLPLGLSDRAGAQIPAPPAGSAVVHIRVGDQRTGATAIGPLAGAEFGLFDANPSASIDANSGFVVGVEPHYTCESDAQGDCSFIVPIGSGTGAVTQNTRLWAAPINAPAGYFANPFFQTAPLTGGGQVNLRHVFQTPALVANQTYTAGTNWITDPGQQTSPSNNTSEFTRRTASSGVWPLSRPNPAFPSQCGVNVGLVVDLSASVGAFSNVKTAMDGTIDALRGTPSQVEITTFGTDSPARGYQNFPLTSVATTTEANALKARYAGWSNPSSQGNYTNWDRGLTTAAASDAASGARHLDIAILLTDGNPTVYGPNATGASPSGYTRFRELENGIASANEVKSLHTRIIAMGVGDGVSSAGAGYNLRSVSGEVKYDGNNALTADYYQTNDYAAASAALRKLVLESCAPSISVIKRVVPEDWDPASGVPIDSVAQTPADQWEFTATTDTAGASVNNSPQNTDLDTGGLSFDVDVSTDHTPATFAITETQADQNSFQYLSDQTTCVRRTQDGEAPVPVTPDPNVTGRFSVDVGIEDAVSCVVYNKMPPNIVPASVTVYKRWLVHSATGTVEYDDPNQPSELHAQLTMSMPGTPANLEHEWGVPRDGYSAGIDNVSISEATFFFGLPGCEATNSEIWSGPPDVPSTTHSLPFTSGPLHAGNNEFTVTNEVDCHSYLTLRKEVASGDANPSSWTLQALGPDDALAGPNGRTDTTAATHVEVTPGATYELAEQADDQPENLVRYAQNDLRTRPLYFPRSTGSWTCQPEGDESGDDSQGTEGAVVVPLGQEWVCTAINQTAFLRVIKHVDGGDAAPDDFAFRVAPVDSSDPDPGQTVHGAAAPGTEVNVRPGTDYRVTEISGPPGYVLTSFTCASGKVLSNPDDFVVEPGGTIVCTATNEHTTWTSSKSSDPPSGSVVQPGDVITYTLTATQLTGPHTIDAVVTDDLSDVLDNATFVHGSIQAETGTADLTGTTLTWTIPKLTGAVTLTYQMKVNADAWGAALRNHIVAPAPPTGPGDPGDPSDPGDSQFVPCTGTSCGETVHDTPPGPPPGAVGSTGGSTPVAGPIANTGASTARDLGLAAVLLVSGAAFLVAGRRRRRT